MPNGGCGGKGATSGGGKGGKNGGGGGKGGGASNGSPAWDCHICGLPANFGWRLRCRGCDAIRKGKAGQGGSGAAAASDASQGGQQQRQQTLAERQLRQVREEQRKQRRADEEEKRQLKEALARMRAEAENRKPKGAGDEEGDGDADADDDEVDGPPNAYASWTEEERQRKLEEARGGLAYFIGKFGEGSAEANSTRDEIEAIQRASRGAKPFKAHRSLLERKRERLREKQDRDEAEVTRITAELEDLETKRKDLQATIDERRKQIGQVEEELAVLVKKALAEGDAAGAAGRNDVDGSMPWSAQTAAASLQAMASRPGIPPEFATLLAHVMQAAQAIANATSANSAPGANPAEGGASTSHRGSQPQQQAQQQGQANHPTSTTGGKGSLSDATTTALTPQGKWNEAAGGSTEGGGGRGEHDSMQVDATGPNGNQETTANTEQTEDKEPELLEAETFDASIDEGVAESINKLPVADQEKLKAALGARGGRRWTAEGAQGKGAAGGRDRERSPRPTKGGQGQADL